MSLKSCYHLKYLVKQEILSDTTAETCIEVFIIYMYLLLTLGPYQLNYYLKAHY